MPAISPPPPIGTKMQLDVTLDVSAGAADFTINVDQDQLTQFAGPGAIADHLAEAQARLDFRNPQTMKLDHSIQVPCRGIDHIVNGRDQIVWIAVIKL